MRDYIWRYPRGSYIQESWFDLGNPCLSITVGYAALLAGWFWLDLPNNDIGNLIYIVAGALFKPEAAADTQATGTARQGYR